MFAVFSLIFFNDFLVLCVYAFREMVFQSSRSSLVYPNKDIQGMACCFQFCDGVVALVRWQHTMLHHVRLSCSYKSHVSCFGFDEGLLLPTECCKLKRPHFARVYLMSSVLDLAMDLFAWCWKLHFHSLLNSKLQKQ